MDPELEVFLPPLGPNLQLSGRSLERLFGDLLRFIEKSNSLGLSSIEWAKIAPLSPHYGIDVIDPSPLPYRIESLDGTNVVYNTILGTGTSNGQLYHLEIQVDKLSRFMGQEEVSDLHLVVDEDDDPIDSKESPIHEYKFYSSGTSGAITFVIRPAEFSEADLVHFEPQKIEQRFMKYKDKKPTANCPTPSMCFHTLYKIIHQPLVSDEKKEIMINNPTLNMRLNPNILYKIHFTVNNEKKSFVPPDLHDFSTPLTAELRKTMFRQLMEAAYRGVCNQSNGKESASKQSPSFQGIRRVSALPEILEELGCGNSFTSITYSLPPSASELNKSFIILGATQDFNDNKILARYYRQSTYDPSNTHHYIDSLSAIAQARQSEFLQVKVTELMSLGIVGVQDTVQAYKLFDLQPESEIDEDTLVEVYKKAVLDKPKMKSEYRTALELIGNSRDSRGILQFLAEEDMSVPEAFRFLEIDDTAYDGAVIAAYELKTSLEEDDAMAKKALLAIAKSRKSGVLLNFYEMQTFGTMPEVSLDEAYELVGATSGIDDENILAVFQIRLNDQPSEVLELRNALRTIGKARQSTTIYKYLKGNEYDEEADNKGVQDCPVGLRNIGNTCYLNSLLQFYFTLTPFRSSILEFSTANMSEDLTDEVAQRKKIGGRMVPLTEIKRAQRFIVDLSQLFSQLIHSDKQYISPTKELAYLALVSARDDIPQPDLATIDDADEDGDDDEILITHERRVSEGHQVQPVSSSSIIRYNPKNDSDTEIDVDGSAYGSEDLTAVENPLLGNQAMDLDPPEIDKENEKPQSEIHLHKRRSFVASTRSGDEEEAGSFDQSSEHPQDSHIISVKSVPDGYQSDDSNDDSGAERLRRKSITRPNQSPKKKKRIDSFNLNVLDYTTFGSQQDVAECIENVLFQVEAAFKPRGFDEDGEQLDLVKDLFYGTTKQILESAKDGSNRREKQERFSSILVDVAEGSRDMYEALDAYFGEDILQLDDGETRRSVVISSLPPVLQIQIQRVQFDRVRNQPFKSLALLDYDEVIYLDRYIESDNPVILSKRQNVRDWRQELKEVQKELDELDGSKDSSHVSLVETLTSTRTWLESLKKSQASNQSSDSGVTEMAGGVEQSVETPERNPLLVSDKTIETLTSQIEAVTNKQKSLQEKATNLSENIKNQFSDMKQHGYRIHSVFVHRGEATFGHYWIYIRDYEKGVFRKYNDEIITEVPDSEVFDKTENNTATPYFLVFIREDVAYDYSRALLRKPAKEPAQEFVKELKDSSS